MTAFSKWALGIILLAVISFSYLIAEQFYKPLWDARAAIRYSLHHAARDNNVTLVRILSNVPGLKDKIYISRGIKMPFIKGSPAEFAITHKSYEALEALLQSGASIDNGKRIELLKTAILIDDYTSFKMLIDYGADIYAFDDYKTGNYLSIAAQGKCSSNPKIIDYLLKEGLDINERITGTQGKDDGNTPLYKAAISNCAPKVKLFLEKGADKNMLVYGKTVLDHLKNPNFLLQYMNRDYSEIIEILETYPNNGEEN